MTATAGSAAQTRPTTGFWPVVLCWLAVALDGYDLVVLGAVIPTLDSTGALGFTRLAHDRRDTRARRRRHRCRRRRSGHRPVRPPQDPHLAASRGSRCSPSRSRSPRAPPSSSCCASSPAWVSAPACRPPSTFMSEYAGDRTASSAMTRMMTGYHVGAVLTALLALLVIPGFGWEAMFVIGGVAGLLVVPLMWAKLPESQAFLAATAGKRRTGASGRGRARQAAARQHRPLGRVVHGPAARLRPQHLAARGSWARRATPSTPASRCCSPSTSARCSG